MFYNAWCAPPRWTGLLEEIAERLRSSKALLQLWQHYKQLHQQSCTSVLQQEESAHQLLKSACSTDLADDEVSGWIRECSVSTGRSSSVCLSWFFSLFFWRVNL